MTGPISKPHEALLDQDYESTAAILSKEFVLHPGCFAFRISLVATTAGAINIEEIGLNKVFRPLFNETADPNDPVNINFIHNAGVVRVRFTPDAPGAGNVKVEGFYSGYGGSVA